MVCKYRDYRGDVGVILQNTSKGPGLIESIKLFLGLQTEPSNVFKVKKGDRIAQLVLEKIDLPDITEVDELDTQTRGEGGFGSTGRS
jgi:dUTPase